MKKNHAVLIAAPLFKTYPSVNSFHVTTDGQAFELKHNAEAHASFLNKEKPVVISVERDEEAEEEEIIADAPAATTAIEDELNDETEEEETEEDETEEDETEAEVFTAETPAQAAVISTEENTSQETETEKAVAPVTTVKKPGTKKVTKAKANKKK